MTTRYNLLTEPIFTLDTPAGARDTASLPVVLDRLARGVALDFGALQAHQVQSWESLVIQLGALATVAHGGTLPPDEDGWRAALRTLTDGKDEPWCLVVEDIKQAAFMQPPMTGKDFRDPKKVIEAADELDMLVTSKNHDVKISRATRARPEHWVFVLTNLQTSDGFAGRDNYGIARMNGGYGSRPSLGATPGLTLAARFRRDLSLWNDRRATLADDFGMRPTGGAALLWTLPWDSESSLSVAELDPCFIELCRPVRLALQHDRLVAWKSSTKVRRIDAEARKGELGDIWMPIKRGDERTAFTAGGNGFGYKVMAELLLGESYDRAAAMELQSGERGEMFVLARVLPRGQGKTQGLHERVVPIPEKVRGSIFSSGTPRMTLSRLARTRVELVGAVQSKVLHPALCALLQAAAPDQKLDLKDDRTQRWRRAHDERVDALFFERLWDDAEVAATDLNEADRRWQRCVVDLAREVFREALEAVPLPSVRVYRARAIAERVFDLSARKHFAAAFLPLPDAPAKEQHP